MCQNILYLDHSLLEYDPCGLVRLSFLGDGDSKFIGSHLPDVIFQKTMSLYPLQ